MRRYSREVDRLTTTFDGRSAPAAGFWTDYPASASRDYSVIRLHDAWARYCRSLVLVSAQGGMTSLDGTRLRRSVPPDVRPLDALKPLLPQSQQRRRNWEPAWHIGGQTINAATLLRVVNITSISLALGASVRQLDELRAVRNYVAHRSPTAAAGLAPLRRRIGVSSAVPVERILSLHLLPGWWSAEPVRGVGRGGKGRDDCGRALGRGRREAASTRVAAN